MGKYMKYFTRDFCCDLMTKTTDAMLKAIIIILCTD